MPDLTLAQWRRRALAAECRVDELCAELDRWKDRALHEPRTATSLDTEPAIAPI